MADDIEDDNEQLSDYWYLDDLGVDYYTGVGRPRTTYPDSRVEALAESLLEWVKVGVKELAEADGEPKNLLLKQWMFENGVNPVAVTRLKKRNQRFKLAYEVAKEFQEHALTTCGIFSKGRGADSGFIKFMLGVVHKWKEPTNEDKGDEQVGKALRSFSEAVSFQRARLDEDK